jgi:S1-C subfamily serine protease
MPASRVGAASCVLDGDIIVAVDSQEIKSFQDLTVYLENQTVVGDMVEVTIIRAGQEQTVQATLAEQPPSQ